MSSTSIDQDPRSPLPDLHSVRSSLRDPAFDDDAHIWIALIVLIPIAFISILCIVTACIYRHRKKRAQQHTINSSMTPIGQHNSQRNIFVIEELPPSYDQISETKKDLQFIPRNNNTYEQFHLSPITPPPPYHSNLIDSTKW